MMELDFRGLSKDLTKGFILREYQERNPQLIADFQEKAEHLYQFDNIFHAKVDCVVAGVLHIVQNHIKEG